MLNFFKNKKVATEDNDISIISVTSLLIHAAKIDENYTLKEEEIIKKTLLSFKVNLNDLDEIIFEAKK